MIMKAVTLFEVMTFAEQPFKSLSDFRFVEFALNETDQLATKIGRLRVLVGHLKNTVLGFMASTTLVGCVFPRLGRL